MKKALTDNEWVDLIKKTVEFYKKDLRMGQSYMNALFLVRRDLYDEVTNTINDPFYDDDKILVFISYLNALDKENKL